MRRLQREQESKSPFVFVSERGTPFSNRGFQAMVERAARAAGLDMKIHPHMLRHSCAIWGTGQSSIQSDTPSWPLRASRTRFSVSWPEADELLWRTAFRVDYADFQNGITSGICDPWNGVQ
jgi:hypothetical protein